MREAIFELIKRITPVDELEKDHLDDATSWLRSSSEIYRLKKPDIPNKHLVSYFVVYDPLQEEILLVDHKNAGLWLPAGGHVDPGEDPKETAKRECREELNIEPEFLFEDPLFFTQTITFGLHAGHTDVSFWYVFKGNTGTIYDFDKREFNAIQWYKLDEIPFEKSDPHMKRFLKKLKCNLSK